MQVVITTAPAPLVTVDEAKVALGESGNDRDDLIEALIAAAQAELDGPKGWVGISVAEQSVEVTADAFDAPLIRLPGGPIIGTPVITYLDSSGAEQTLATTGYVVSDGVVSLAAGATWPALADRLGSVTVAYDVGIEDAADPRIQQMKVAIIMHVRMTLDQFEMEPMRRAIEALVRPLWHPSI